MKINKLQIVNFQGIKKSRDFVFDDNIYAICQKNGSGKTSLVNALRYGITGKKPVNDAMTKDAASMAVGITLGNGISYIRQEFSDKPAKFYMNGKTVRKQDIDKSIQGYSHVSQSTMNIASSSDVLAGLSPQEFGALLLSYTPNNVTIEQILSYLPDISENAKMSVLVNLPDSNFGSEAINNFYGMCADARRDLKRKMSEYYGAAKAFSSMRELEHDSSYYKAQYDKLQLSFQSVAEQMKKCVEYDKAVEIRKKQEEDIRTLEAEYKGLQAPNVKEEEILILEEKIASKQQIIETTKRSVYRTKDALASLKKAYETILQPVCPLSEKLKCTVDKTPVTSEIEEKMKAMTDSITDDEKNLETANKELEKLQKDLAGLKEKLTIRDKAASLKERIENLKKGLISVPEKPEKVENAESLSVSIDQHLKAYHYALEYEKMKAAAEQYNKLSDELKDYEYLVAAFAPKGPVNQKLASHYISVFEDRCNDKAAEINKNLHIKFVVRNGVTALMKTDDTDVYKPYQALSGGERAYMIFLILDMLNALTGYKILILDELSVLDDDAFRTLIDVIYRYKDDYDLILLSMAKHGDMEDVIKSYGIKEIEV